MKLQKIQYFTINSLATLVLLWSMSSCVGKKKFDEMESTKNSIENTLHQTRKDLDNAQKDLMVAEDSIQALQGDIADRDATIEALSKDLEETQSELNYAQMNQSEAATALQECEAEAARLNALLEEQKAKTAALRETILGALAGLADADLQVEERNGRVHVVLSQKLLFATGSTSINQDGKQAIMSLAGVLVEHDDLDILVEGHTDSDGPEDINWNLSMGRAMAITNILIQKGVNPERITAAGRGEHAPVAPNDTAENKAKNRRTEIILSPKLGTIYDLLESE